MMRWPGLWSANKKKDSNADQSKCTQMVLCGLQTEHHFEIQQQACESTQRPPHHRRAF
jgi:hypothetical protein